MAIQTDPTLLAENVLCKLFILALVAVILWRRRESPQEIGFKRQGVLRGAALGLSPGVGELQILRIVLSNLLSPAFVLILTKYRRNTRRAVSS